MKQYKKAFDEFNTCDNEVSKEVNGNVKMSEDDYIAERATEVDLFAKHEEFRAKDSLAVKRELEAAISDLDDDTKSTIRRCVRDIRDRRAHTERIHGVQRFIEGMLDAEVPDNLIIKLLGKHWFIEAEKAARDLNRIKTTLHPINEVCHYMGMMGFSEDEIVETTSVKAYDKLIKDQDLWKLPADELYEILADQYNCNSTAMRRHGTSGERGAANTASGFLRSLISTAKRLKSNRIHAKEWSEFKRIINSLEKSEDVKRKLNQHRDKGKNDELPTLEELRTRLDALQKSLGDSDD